MENINNLSEIEVEFDLFSETDVIEINLYSIIGAIVIIMLITIVASFSIFGAGINSAGTSLLGKYMSFFAVFALLQLGTAYYVGRLAWFGVLILVIFTIVYGLKGLNLISSGQADNE
jgi:hypothetical protein